MLGDGSRGSILTVEWVRAVCARLGGKVVVAVVGLTY